MISLNFNKRFLKICCSNCKVFFALMSKSTIFALSSGLGKCGVSVIRVSGDGVRTALVEIGGFQKLPQPRRAELRTIRDPISKEVIDQGLVFWFPKPKSFTGEDCCEFQIHGSTAVISALLNSLGKLDNFRPAEPGEFTRRAFYSGKMDLTSVEGLSALIDSETELQRKHALYQMGGALFSLYTEWSQKLLKCLAYLEAYIDFDEDQDIDKEAFDTVQQEVQSLIHHIKKHIEDGRRGERIREGVNMTILGAPNSGKSSLLNVLSKRPAAIVSPIPGTTRDVVQTHLDINGFPLNIADTAGLRGDPADPVEAEGISRAIHCADTSDLLLLILDAALLIEWAMTKNIKTITWKEFKMYFKAWIKSLGIEAQIMQCYNLKDIMESEDISTDRYSQGMIILNKVDLINSTNIIDSNVRNSSFVCEVSCKTEYGIENLLQKMTTKLENLCGDPKRAQVGFSKPYQRYCLEECLSCLNRYLEMESARTPADLCAEELRKAMNCFGRLTGKVSAEQLLDVIFRDFCIGK